jgi:CRISPR-associated endonuclease/helicase Cas3
MFFAHSNGITDKNLWQPLHEHLRAVGRLSGSNGQKFGAANAALLAGLLHDLGKYSVAFQRRLEGGDKVDHATAGAEEIVKLARTNQDRVMAHIIAHAIAGHYAGPSVAGVRYRTAAVSERLISVFLSSYVGHVDRRISVFLLTLCHDNEGAYAR